jgi:hypothetical protein
MVAKVQHAYENCILLSNIRKNTLLHRTSLELKFGGGLIQLENHMSENPVLISRHAQWCKTSKLQGLQGGTFVMNNGSRASCHHRIHLSFH